MKALGSQTARNTEITRKQSQNRHEKTIHQNLPTKQREKAGELPVHRGLLNVNPIQGPINLQKHK